MAFVERDGGVRLYWEDQGDGPGLLVGHSYIQHPQVLAPLCDELARDHRVIRYDTRGVGRSTREGPYDMGTDVEDLIAVVEAAGPISAMVMNGDATNRATHAAARRPDLIPFLISLETLPLAAGAATDTDALVGSGSVLSALIVTMRADYRTGMMAAIQRGNPEMTNEQIRDRLDQTVAYIPHEPGLSRLEEWIGDDPVADALTLGDRLVIAFEGAGAWFTADLLESGREFLPEARFVRLEGGPISRPDLVAGVVRELTAAARAAG